MPNATEVDLKLKGHLPVCQALGVQATKLLVAILEPKVRRPLRSRHRLLANK
jgi:hypothetical protein